MARYTGIVGIVYYSMQMEDNAEQCNARMRRFCGKMHEARSAMQGAPSGRHTRIPARLGR